MKKEKHTPTHTHTHTHIHIHIHISTYMHRPGGRGGVVVVVCVCIRRGQRGRIKQSGNTRGDMWVVVGVYEVPQGVAEGSEG